MINPSSAKEIAYSTLVAERKRCRRCVGLTNPADLAQGRHDGDEIGPWSVWQGNLDAELMVVGQDWGDVDYLIGYSPAADARNPTNMALVGLLGDLGYEIGTTADATGQNVVFFTNSILCMKQGGLQAKIDGGWATHCSDFLRRQIEIISPNVVVGLGLGPFRSVLAAYRLRAPSTMREAIMDTQGRVLRDGIRAFAVYHCGARGQNLNRPMAQQRQDWARLRPFLSHGQAKAS